MTISAAAASARWRSAFAPRVSASWMAGHGAGSPVTRRARPLSARHHVTTLGVAEVRTASRLERAARSSTTSRECRRGGPGGLCAASCSSTSARVAPAGSGASSAGRVPTASRASPAVSAAQAPARVASSTPESSRATGPCLSRRCAQRPAASTSGTITSAATVVEATRSSRRRSRPVPINTSGFEDSSSSVLEGVPGLKRGWPVLDGPRLRIASSLRTASPLHTALSLRTAGSRRQLVGLWVSVSRWATVVTHDSSRDVRLIILDADVVKGVRFARAAQLDCRDHRVEKSVLLPMVLQQTAQDVFHHLGLIDDLRRPEIQHRESRRLRQAILESGSRLSRPLETSPTNLYQDLVVGKTEIEDERRFGQREQVDVLFPDLVKDRREMRFAESNDSATKTRCDVGGERNASSVSLRCREMLKRRHARSDKLTCNLIRSSRDRHRVPYPQRVLPVHRHADFLAGLGAMQHSLVVATRSTGSIRAMIITVIAHEVRLSADFTFVAERPDSVARPDRARRCPSAIDEKGMFRCHREVQRFRIRRSRSNGHSY